VPLDFFHTRRSCRAFRSESISADILNEILENASRAPSALNMQPWEIHVVADEERVRLSRRLLKAYKELRFTCGPGGAEKPIPDKFIARARASAEGMTQCLGGDESEFKRFVNEGSLNFYGAPVAVLVCIDSSLMPARLFDAGLFTGFLLMAAHMRGVDACPIGLICAYQDVVKDSLNIPESKELVIAAALGYADENAAIRSFRSDRAELRESVRFID
jgi:nitroreductase